MSLPQPSGEFQWAQESWGNALRCPPLAAIAGHCFSTRDLRLEGRGDSGAAGWSALAGALSVAAPLLVRMRQVHCADVFEPHRTAGTTFPEKVSDWPEADIAVSADADVALTVRTADCVPILIADPRTRAVAAVHAGWKGTAAGAALVAVQALMSRYGARPANLIAAVGPSIGPCCYEVGPELANAFSSHPEASSWFTRDERPHLDLWRASRDQLLRAGLPPQQVHVCALCTFDHPSLFHSYRRDGRDAGRLVAAIRSLPGRTP